MRAILTLCVILFFVFKPCIVDAEPVSPVPPVFVKFAPASPLKIETFQTQQNWGSPQGNYCDFVTDSNKNIALGKSVVNVSSTISGPDAITHEDYGIIHNPVNLTDGKYGNGRSWVAANNDTAPTVTIDLGGTRTFRAISFGRDRLGGYVDRNPGLFSIQASTDNITWQDIVKGAKLRLPQAGTVLVTIDGGISAKYVKFTFMQGVGVDEIEIFTNVP